MRKLSTVFIAGLFAMACNNDAEKETGSKIKYNELSMEMIKGNVESYEETPYKTDSAGKPGEMDSCCINVNKIDENGNYVSWMEKDSKGVVKTEVAYSRFDDGLFKGLKETKAGKPSSSMETQVDDKGVYTTAQEFDSAGKLANYYTNVTMNEYGQVTGWKQFDKDSVFRQTGESKFDKTLQTGYIMKDSVGKVKNDNSYKYNDKGEQTEVSRTNITKDSTTTKVTKYTYESHDEMGNWTQRTEWDDKGKAVKVIKRVYTYRKEEEKK
ncbi:MAG: hypothetical protein WDN26_15600 [Chitinophagaceae bacterium]